MISEHRRIPCHYLYAGIVGVPEIIPEILTKYASLNEKSVFLKTGNKSPRENDIKIVSYKN